MASFTVTSGKCVQYDGRLRYGGDGTEYTVKDNYENYVKSAADVVAGLITIVDAFSNDVNNEEQYLCKTVDLSNADANTIGTHEVFTVTGAVQMKVLAECTTDVVGSANTITMSFGDETAASGWIAGTSGEAIDAGEFWFSTTPAKGATTASAKLDRVVSGNDIGYEIATAKASTGIIKFHCWYTPLNNTGAVAAGTLSSLT